jgi:hypothetical protein
VATFEFPPLRVRGRLHWGMGSWRGGAFRAWRRFGIGDGLWDHLGKSGDKPIQPTRRPVRLDRGSIWRAADILVLDLPNVDHLGYRFGINPVKRVVKGGPLVVW